MTDNVVVPVTIQPKNVYGIRPEVIGNIHFTLQQHVIYPVEGVLAFHDYVENKQTFMRFAEHTIPLIISISPNRRLLAILEKTKGQISESICIYDLAVLKKRRTLKLEPTEKHPTNFEISKISFTFDSKNIIVLTKPPEETIFLFMFDKASTILYARAALTNQRGSATCFACNPQDANLTAVGGDNCYRLFQKNEETCTITNNVRLPNLYIASMTWISMDTILAGTNKGQLLIIDNSEIRMRLDARTTETIDLLKEQEEEIEDKEKVVLVASPENTVVCMKSFQKGCAYAIFNKVYVYEKETRDRFERKTILTVKIDIYPEEKYQITNIAINAQQDTIIVTTKHSQIYVGVLIVPETLNTKLLTFKTLGEYIHIDEITQVCVCSWRPVVLTAGKDQTVRIWNYETEKIELVKKYQVDICVAELNPTGLFVALGFSDQLRLMEIFIDDLRIIKTYNFARCQCIKFSNLGHYMAVAYDNIVAITSVYNLDIIRMLKGHNGIVLSLAWSRNDKILVTGGFEGAIYQWNVETGERVNEVVQKNLECRALAVTNDPFSIYAATSKGTLREIRNSDVIRDLKVPNETPLLSMTLSRSDLILFLTSEEGHLYNIQLPFLDAGGGTVTNYKFFESPVTNCCISYDGTLLITATKNGTLAIWVLKNIEGRVAPMDQDLLKCQEVLIQREILKDKVETIANLELRIEQQLAEFQYQSKQTEIMDEQAMAKVHKTYCTAIEELRQKNTDMEQQHVTVLNQVGQEILDREKEYQESLKALGVQYSNRILEEYNKFVNLRSQMIKMRDNYEDKLRKSAGSLQDTIETLEIDFEKQLQERQGLVRQLMEEMANKKNEFIEFCGQVELDNDRSMVECKLKYEKELQTEKDSTLKWRGKAGVLKQKYNTLIDDHDKLRQTFDILKEEHTMFKDEIEEYRCINDDLRKQIEDGKFEMHKKDKYVKETMHENEVLEKYKEVLTQKNRELQAQIEPRERKIKEKRDLIIQTEHELNELNTSSLQLEKEFNELQDKFLSNCNELKLERDRCRLARNFTSQICVDIFHVAGTISQPDLLKDGVRKLYKKYADDRELKNSVILDQQVENEYQQQRNYLEDMIKKYRKKEQAKNSVGKTQKLINDNNKLLDDLHQLHKQLEILRGNEKKLENIIGCGVTEASSVFVKLKINKAYTNVVELEAKHKMEIEKLNEEIQIVKEQNEKLKENMSAVKQAPVEVGGNIGGNTPKSNFFTMND